MAEGSDPGTQQVLGLDASGLREEITSVVVPMLDKLNTKASELQKAFDKAGGSLDATTLRFTQLDESGNKYVVTLDKLEEGWASSVKLLNLSNEALQKNLDLTKRAAEQVTRGSLSEEDYNKRLKAKVKQLREAEEAVAGYRRALESQGKIAEQIRQQDAVHSREIARAGAEQRGNIGTAAGDTFFRAKGKRKAEDIGTPLSSASSLELQTEEEIDAKLAQENQKKAELIRLINEATAAIIRSAAEEAALVEFADKLERKYLDAVRAQTQLTAALTDSKVQGQIRAETEAAAQAKLEAQEAALKRQVVLYEQLLAAAIRRGELDALHLAQVARQGGEFTGQRVTVAGQKRFEGQQLGTLSGQRFSQADLQTEQEIEAVGERLANQKKQQFALVEALTQGLERQVRQEVELDTIAGALEQKYLNLVAAQNQIHAEVADARVQGQLTIEQEKAREAQLEHEKQLLDQQTAQYRALAAMAQRRAEQDALHIATVQRAGGEFAGQRIRIPATNVDELSDVASASHYRRIQNDKEIEAVGRRITQNEQNMLAAANAVEEALIRQAGEETELEATCRRLEQKYLDVAEAARRVKSELVDARVQADLQRQAEEKTTQEYENRRRRLNEQEAQMRRLKELAKETALAEKQATDAARRTAADQVGTQLQRRIPTGMDADSVAKVSAAIGQITSSIAKGQITAEEALRVITAVEKGEATAFEGAAARVANAARRIIAATTQIRATSVSPLIDEQKKYAEAFKKTEKAGTESGLRIFLTWQQLYKLFLIQALHTLVRKFFEALRETVRGTEELEIKIAEIRSISQEAQQSTEAWAAELRALSSEFGTPVLDVAAATYEAISNQIVHGAESALFMRQALEFSKLTVSSAKDSVNLLSSALNSFQLSTDQAQHASEILFETIVLGRVHASEMANSFGRLGSLAAPLGVSLEEVGASIATLTRRGIKYDEVQTLISNTMIRLLKPSEEMTKIFDKWGVSSGEAAVQAFSFLGVMQKLSQETGNSVSETADLFKNIRGTLGAVNFEQAFAQLQSDYETITKKAKEQAAKGLEEVLATPAQKLKEQSEQIKNFFSQDFGESFIRNTVNISNALSDDGLLGVVKNTIKYAGFAAAAWASYGVAQSAVGKITAINTVVEKARAEVRLIEINNTALLAYEEEQLAAAIALENGSAAANLALDQAVVAEGEARVEAKARLVAAQEAYNAVLAQEIPETEAVLAANLELSLATDNYSAALLRVRAVTVANNAANKEAAAAYYANAEAARAAAAAQGEATTATVLGGKALKSVIGFVSNPAFIFAAAAAAIIYLGYKIKQASEAAEDAYKDASEEVIKQSEKVTRKVNEQLAQQENDFKEHLNREYQAVGEFGANVGKIFAKVTDRLKDELKESVDASKESIKAMLNVYDETTRHIEEAWKRALDNIRKLEDDLDRSRQDFADREFQRQLKLAQAKDANELPGKGGGKFVDQNQITLIQKRQAELLAENAKLQAKSEALAKSGTSAESPKRAIELKEIDSNAERQRKNLEEIGKLQDNLEDRRLAIEAQHKKTEDDLADAKKKQQAKLAEDTAKATAEAASDRRKELNASFADEKDRFGKHHNQKLQIAKKAHREEVSDQSNQEEAARDEKERLNREEQNRETAKHIAELEARSKAEADSLTALPTEEKFRQSFVDLSTQVTDQLKEQKKIQEELAALAEKELAARKAGLQPLKVIFDQIEKFKVDKPVLETQEDLDTRLSKFNKLIEDAEATGLLDAGTLDKLVEQREAIARAGEAEVAKHEQELLTQRLINNKKAVEDEFKARKAKLEEESKTTRTTLDEALNIVGTGSDKGFQPGSLSAFVPRPLASFGLSGGLLKGDDIQIAKTLSQYLAELKQAEIDLVEHGQALDPVKIERARAAFKEYQDQIIRGFKGEAGEGQEPSNFTVREIKDAYGNVVNKTNVQSELNTINTAIDTFVTRITAEQATILQNKADLADQEQKRQDAQKRLDELNKQYGFLSTSVNNTNKSFQDLSIELNAIITGFQRLKTTLDNIPPPTPADGHAAGGFIFSPRGTDTVPAMLTPGEYVINAHAARIFHRELRAMNRYAAGGFVGNYNTSVSGSMPNMPSMENNATSYTFGDFHYHGDSSLDSRAQAKAVWSEIQNMIRRGEVRSGAES